MHNGLCRQRHDGVLGPTLRLVEASADLLAERDRLAQALADQEIAYAGLEQTYLAVSDAHAALVDKVSALAAEAIR